MKTYHVPELKVFGTVAQLTNTPAPVGNKIIAEPSDGNYLGQLPLNGSCHCIPG